MVRGRSRQGRPLASFRSRLKRPLASPAWERKDRSLRSRPSSAGRWPFVPPCSRSWRAHLPPSQLCGCGKVRKTPRENPHSSTRPGPLAGESGSRSLCRRGASGVLRAKAKTSQELLPKYIEQDAKQGPSSQFAERAGSGLQAVLQQQNASRASAYSPKS